MRKFSLLTATSAAVIFAFGIAAGQILGLGATQAASPKSAAHPFAGHHGGPGSFQPGARGTVTAVNGDVITMTPDTDSYGPTTYAKVTTIDVSSTTTFHVGPNSTASLSEIKVGDHVGAQGTLSSDGTTLSATSVEMFGPGGPGGPGRPGPMFAPGAHGTVTAVNGDVITITEDKSPTTGDEYAKVTTIDVSASTTYHAGPHATANLDSVKIGSHISAQGILSADGTTVTATGVEIGGPADGPGRRGPGGPPGFGGSQPPPLR